MSAVRRAWVENWSRIMVVMLVAFSVGTCINFVLIGLTIHEQGQQSQSGANARTQQCVAKPIAAKEQRDFHARGRISWKELQTMLRAYPSVEECTALGVRER